ncbi:polysaccharide biosynthesis tyrosine autokinase [Agrococcus sp. 1P02AA]|uniref:polysaccharide biosynthesis tyrosine autokinase n=1 Tax=Agrococcus sp. 1P02AA TaxID=3132259 RepID=UPI0039A70B9E
MSAPLRAATVDPGTWSLAHVWEALRKLWLLILGFAMVGGAVGYAVAASTEPQFQARASLYFALDQGTSGADLNQGSAYTQNQMLSFARLATSSRVLEPVIDELDLGTTPRDLARSVAITIPQDTVILEVTVTSTDRMRASEIANSVSTELAAVVQDVAAQGVAGAATISASVIDDAVPPQSQSSPNKPREAALAALVGLLLGMLVATILTIADTRVRNEAAVARVTDLPVLGVVSRPKRGGDPSLVVAREPHSAIAEDIRRVQSALAFTALDADSRRLLVTSASPGEGKSTFATNLAVALADTGDSTLVIDGDLRRPRVSELFGLDGAAGLTGVLIGEVDLADALVPWRESGPDILVSGQVPPNPASVVTSDAFGSLLDAVAERYEVVIIDAPPVLTVADANLLAPQVDGVVVIVDARKTRRAQLANTIRSLEAAGGRILGIVLTKARPAKQTAYYVQTAEPKRFRRKPPAERGSAGAQ